MKPFRGLNRGASIYIHCFHKETQKQKLLSYFSEKKNREQSPHILFPSSIADKEGRLGDISDIEQDFFKTLTSYFLFLFLKCIFCVKKNVLVVKIAKGESSAFLANVFPHN